MHALPIGSNHVLLLIRLGTLPTLQCLVGDELVVKIADFGMGRVVDEIYTARTGTKMPIKWTAPEALCYDAFSIKSDVWSFGILLWEVITFGDQPYKGIESRDLVMKLESGYRMPQPPKCSDTMYSVRVVSVAMYLRPPEQLF